MADFGENQRLAGGELEIKTDNDNYLLIILLSNLMIKKKLSHSNIVTTSTSYPEKESYRA